MNRASVFEWHKRFKEGRESTRDDERCGRSKEVRASELISQIKNFMAKDRRVSIETISAQFDVSVGTVHTIIRQELKMRKICAKFIPRLLREDQKKDVFMRAGRWSSWSIQMPQFFMLWWPAVKAGSAAISQRPKDRVSSESMLALPGPRRPDRANPPTNFWWYFFFDSTGMIYMHWVPTGQTVNKEYYVEVLREFSKRSQGKRPALCKSGQWHFHLDNAPIHNSILVTVPIVLTLLPVTFGYSLSSRKKIRGWRYGTIEGMKEAVTKVIDTLTQEDFDGTF